MVPADQMELRAFVERRTGLRAILKSSRPRVLATFPEQQRSWPCQRVPPSLRFGRPGVSSGNRASGRLMVKLKVRRGTALRIWEAAGLGLAISTAITAALAAVLWLIFVVE